MITPEDMEIKEIKEYKSLLTGEVPEALLELAISEDTPLRIAQICLENRIEDETKIEKIAYQVGLVLLGELTPRELTEALELEVPLESDVAEKIYLETNRLLFAPVKESLTELYKEEVTATTPKPQPPTEEPKKPPGKDIYREPVE